MKKLLLLIVEKLQPVSSQPKRLEMKIKLAVFLFSSVLISTNASAWNFYWTLTGAIPEATVGRDGSNCVSRNTQAGDIVSLGSQIMTVKSTSGTSPKCIGSDSPIGALLEISPSTSEFIKVLSTIAIPENYKKNQLTPQNIKDNALLIVTSSDQESAIALFAINKEQVKIDYFQYATETFRRLSTFLENPVETEIEVLTINGVKAWKSLTTGIDNTGGYRKPITYLQIMYEGNSQFILLRQWAGEDRFSALRSGFEVTSASIQNIVGENTSISRGLNKPLPNPTLSVSESKTSSSQQKNKSSVDAVGKLETLKNLLDKGLITQKDFDSKKTEILKSL